MALDARRRSAIYQSLTPLIGEENANDLMSQFPSVEADELVTKQFLRAELADLRDEMAELRSELRGEIGELRTSMAQLEARLTVRMGAGLAATTAILGTLIAVG